jgi:hypothetical protein
MPIPCRRSVFKERLIPAIASLPNRWGALSPLRDAVPRKTAPSAAAAVFQWA